MSSIWPADDQVALDGFYGRHALGSTGTPTIGWEQAQLVTFPTPYEMVLAWDVNRAVTRIRCHRLVAESLRRILVALLVRFPTAEARREAGIDLWGGCYEFRRISGSSRLSCHAWGAAVDLDPARNPQGAPLRSHLPGAVVAAFRAEGWPWGGDFRGRPDSMHFQATA